MSVNSFDLSAHVASSTKDSIYVKWRVESAVGGHSQRDLIQGFEVRYQAIGSTVVQYSQRLDSSISAYDITQLHENTFYDICVKAYVRYNANATSSFALATGSGAGAAGAAAAASASSAQDVCTKGTTATDSLAVALGSTFGAFLALGFIVFLVFLAKWQHTRKVGKQKVPIPAYDETGVQELRECDDDDDDLDDDDDDPKDLFLASEAQLPDDLAMSEFSAHSSELSIALYADRTSPDAMDSDGGGMTSEQPSYVTDGQHLYQEDWIAVTPYADPRQSITESSIQKELLRPPPIPGIILRPQQPTDSGTPDQTRSKPSTAPKNRLNSAAEPVLDSEDTGAASHGTGLNSDEASEFLTAEDQTIHYHRPLKPTASNLW